MARFHFSLSSFVNRHAAAAVVSQRTIRALRLDEALEAREAHEAPQGPGWFDSSWDLIRGLDVREGLPGDARLNEWLEVCLRAEPASAVAECHEQPRARLVPAPAHGAFVDALQFGDLDLAVAAEVAHLDEFSEFGIDGLELA